MPTALLPAGEPPGFPDCAKCPYRLAGPARICVACAGKTLDAVDPRACPVCSQRLDNGSTCRNWLCDDPNRSIERIDAIAYLTGALKAKVHRYKYEGATGWSLIFGRLLVGWLEAHAAADPPGLIVANPTYVDPRTSGPGHIEAIIKSAATADYEGRWAFDAGTAAAIIKTRPTEKSAGRTATAKRDAAAELRAVLAIPDPRRTQGRDILIFNDVCTTGSQLDAIAGCLLHDGHATRVRAVVLARAPWQPR